MRLFIEPTCGRVELGINKNKMFNFQIIFGHRKSNFSLKKGLGVLIFLGILTACENDLAEVSKFIDEDEIAVEVGEEVEMLYSDSGRVEMKIIAPLLHRHLNKRIPKREFPKGLDVFFLDENQKVQSWLIGKYAIEDENKQIITIQDSVVLFNHNSEMLETDELIWDQATNKIHTKRFVRITTKDEQITGYGFEADREFKFWKIIAPQGRVKIDPDNLEN